MFEAKLKHLEFIQNVISRMNHNSFLLKGWSVTIVSAMLAIYSSTSKIDLFLISIFPVLVFWLLDTYYLSQERKFRGLYNDIAEVSENPHLLKEFEMRPDLYTGDKFSFWNVFWSQTIWKFYLSIIILLIGLFIYLKFIK